MAVDVTVVPHRDAENHACSQRRNARGMSGECSFTHLRHDGVTVTETTWTCEKCTNRTNNVVRQLPAWPTDAKAARGSVRAAFLCCDCVMHPETADRRKKLARPFMNRERAVELVATAEALAMSQ